MAVGYLAARIVDAMFIAVMTLLIMVQVPLAQEAVKAGAADSAFLRTVSGVLAEANLYAYGIAMTALGVAGLILCTVLLRTRLLPRFLSVWGLVGYGIILVGSVLEILGFHLSSVHAIPGGLWEVFIGVWLITKGFNRSSAQVVPATSVPFSQMSTSVVIGAVV